MENEIMNSETMETAVAATEDIVEAATGTGWKVAAGIGIGGLVIVGAAAAYKKFIKPRLTKYHSPKQRPQDEEPIDVDATEYFDDDEDVKPKEEQK